MKIQLERVGDTLDFRATNEAGCAVDISAAATHGGRGQGVRPMQLLVMGLGECSGIDMLSILVKGRQPVETFSVVLEADRAQDAVPAPFMRIYAHYHFTGALQPEAARRAIELSRGKYCSVAKTLEKTAEVHYAFTINGIRYA
jgi:putative redox protein